MGIAALLLIGFITLSAQDFYDINTINTIEITFTESNWDQILDNLYAAGNEERLVGSAVINGVAFDSVGVRYKGNSSYSPQNIKNPLNIKLDQVIDDQTYEGYGTLKLANGFKDPTFIRETLGYEIAAKYGPASKANYINVYVNNELIGLYTSVQSVDKHFCRSFFAEDEGTLIKGNPVGGPGGSAANICYLGSDSTAYYTSYELKSDFGWQDLVDLCYTLNLNTSNIEDILDVDRVLWFLAFHNTLVSNDSPIMAPHNFYLYMDDNDQFNYIYWDLNMTFGTFSGGPGSPPMSVTQLQHFDPFYNINNDNYPIVSKLLSVPEYQKIYIAHMKTILEENFANGWYETRALELQNIIDASVQADQNKFYTYDDFINNIHNSIFGSGPSFTIGITELMEERVNFLNNHSSFNVIEPDIIDISSSPDIIEPNSVAWVTVETENTNSLKIGIRQNEQDVFQKLEMYDDGNHNDVLAGDGIFGIQLDTAYNDIQYYIYAENDDAVKFAPQRAEYEFYTLEVITELVINEFLASNETILADEWGEYDDWLELYNNSENLIDLSGYYLSDDPEMLDRWQFPNGITIGAEEYLLIWLDGDGAAQGPLHTNFRLSASGESIIISDPDLNIVDAYTFGEQTTDISMGRYPNAIGPFYFMTSTPLASNLPGLQNDPELPAPQIFLTNYPNPFNPSTAISFAVNSSELPTRLCIYNLRGQKVKTLINNLLTAGAHSVSWAGVDDSGRKVANGIYFCRLENGENKLDRKMLLLK